jgi:rare lipoprotein A
MAKNMLASFLKKFAFLLCMIPAALFFFIVFDAPLQAQDVSTPQTVAADQKDSPTLEQSEGTVGIATYYHNRYRGRKTSSGAIYNSRKMTAAHPSLPLGQRLKVTNLANNRSVVVTVNDRCKKRNFELIDLSRAAASKLGFLRAGSTRVFMVPLEEE